MRNKPYHIPQTKARPEPKKPQIVPKVYYTIIQSGQPVFSGETGALDWLFDRKYKVGKKQADSLILRVTTIKETNDYYYNKLEK